MTAYSTEGTLLQRGNGAVPEVFTTCIQIKSVGPLGFQRGLVDTTTLTSSQREYILALKDGQELNIEGQYDPDSAEQVGFRDDNETGVLRNIRVVLPDGLGGVLETWTIPTRVMNWQTNVGIDDVLALSMTFKPTGAPTIA